MPYPGIIAGRVLNQAAPVNRAHPLNRGLVAAWLAQPAAAGASGWGSLSFRDLLGRNHGTLTNGAAWAGSRGRQGGYGAVSFDGTDDYVDVPVALAITVPLTLSFWVRPNSVSTSQYLSDSLSGLSNSNGLACIVGFQSGNYNVFRDSGSGGQYPTGTAANSQIAASGAGLWDFVTWTYDGTTVVGYTNGVQRASVTASSWTTAATITGRRLGRPYTTATNQFAGAQDDLRAYSRALSGSEVWLLYDQSRRGHPETLNWLTGRAHMASSPAAGGGGNRRRRLLIGA